MNASTDALSTGALANSSQVPAELLDSIEVGIAMLDRNFKVQVWNKFLVDVREVCQLSGIQ